MVDLNTYLGVKKAEEKQATHSTNKDAGTALDMTDFLKLMCVSLQNQTMDNQADMTDMMNQMVQMSVIQAISDISTLINDSTTLSYSASLVGKEVTVGQYEGSKLKEITGVITGTGMLNGEQVVFIGDDPYKLSEIMCVGKLPEAKEEEPENPENPDKPEEGGQENPNPVI